MFTGLGRSELVTSRVIKSPPAVTTYPKFREHLLGFGIAQFEEAVRDGPGTLVLSYEQNQEEIPYEFVIRHGEVVYNPDTLEEFRVETYFVRHQSVLTPIQRYHRVVTTETLPPTVLSDRTNSFPAVLGGVTREVVPISGSLERELVDALSPLTLTETPFQSARESLDELVSGEFQPLEHGGNPTQPESDLYGEGTWRAQCSGERAVARTAKEYFGAA